MVVVVVIVMVVVCVCVCMHTNMCIFFHILFLLSTSVYLNIFTSILLPCSRDKKTRVKLDSKENVI